MGLPFGVLVFACFQVAWLVTEDLRNNKFLRIAACLAAVAFGCSGVADIIQIGTSFNEIPVAALSVIGLWFLLQAPGKSIKWESWSAFIAGLLFGAAAGLKFTAGLYAPGAGVLCLAFPGSLFDRLKRATLLSLSWTITVSGLWGPWGYRLYKLTGNPLFPMFNNVFHSPWVAPINGRDMHAMPSGVLQAIFYPFYWLRLSHKVIELPFVDARYAIAFVSVVAVGILYITQKPQTGRTIAARRGDYLALYIVITYAVWEAMFSILRYSAGLESILGSLLIVAIFRIFQATSLPRRARHIIAAALAVFSVILCAFTVYPNFGRVPYGKTVWQADVPALPAASAVVFINYPSAFFAPFLASQSPGATFIGIPPYIDTSEFVGYRLNAMIHQRVAAASHLYVVLAQNTLPPIWRLNDFGLQVDFSKCQQMTANISPDFNLCPAEYVPGVDKQAGHGFHLAAMSVSNNPQINLSVSSHAACVYTNAPETIDLKYEEKQLIPGMTIYVQTPPAKAFLWGGPTPPSVLKTGDWALGGLHLIFRNADGTSLGDFALQYIPCG
ncbi:MAG: hypothetical protein KGH75_04395 [Rhodospirillales bacterium]|nr:hypothetical protein [Rhodospirillales bacterium]